MGQKDSNKTFDADILQCKADILRARQSAALMETTKRKAKEKEQARVSQVTSGEKIQAPPAVGIPTQLTRGKKKAEIEQKSNVPPRKQITDVQSGKEESGETESVSVAGDQREEKPSEDAGYSQSNEVKFIEQVKSMRAGGEQTDRTEVPRFDLAEQIMAEQRKNSAAKRKAPSRKIVSVKEQTRDGGPAGPSEQEAVGEEKEFSSSQEEIIARIVGRDIERLCKGRDQRGQKSFGDQRF